MTMHNKPHIQYNKAGTLLAVLLFLCGCGAATYPAGPTAATLDPMGGYGNWSSQDGTLNLYYPHTWYSFDNTAALLQLLSPLEDTTPDYREYVTVGLMDIPEGKTAKQVADQTSQDLQEYYNGLQVLEAGTVPLGGITAEKRVYTGTAKQGGLELYFEQYTWLAGQGSYSLTFVTTLTKKNDYLADFRFIMAHMDIQP